MEKDAPYAVGIFYSIWTLEEVIFLIFLEKMLGISKGF